MYNTSLCLIFYNAVFCLESPPGLEPGGYSPSYTSSNFSAISFTERTAEFTSLAIVDIVEK